MELQYNIYSFKFIFNFCAPIFGYYSLFYHKYNPSRDLQNAAVRGRAAFTGTYVYSGDILKDIDNCIKLYELTNVVEKTADQNMEFLEKELPLLQSDLMEDYDKIKEQISYSQAVFLHPYFELYWNKAYYTPQEKETFNRGILYDLLPDVANKLNSAVKKHDKLTEKLGKIWTDSLVRGPEEYLESIVTLSHQKIRLWKDLHSKGLDHNITFHSEPLYNLRNLFKQLDFEESRTDQDSTLYFNWIYSINRTLQQIFYTRKPLMFPIWELKANIIPSFLQEHAPSLSEFWLWFQVANERIGQKIHNVQNAIVQTKKIISAHHAEVRSTFDSFRDTIVQINTWPVYDSEEDYFKVKNGWSSEEYRNYMSMVKYFKGSSFFRDLR